MTKANPYKDLIGVIKKSREQGKVPFEDKFLKEFNETLCKIEAERKKGHPTSTEHYRPSSIYGCKRMLWAARKGIPEELEFSPVLIGITESGTDRHERIQTVIEKMDNVYCIDVEAQVKQANLKGIKTEVVEKKEHETKCRNKELYLSFMPDGLIRYEGIKTLVEIKTESVYKWQVRTAPAEEHIKQATCYAMGLGVEHIFFIYEDRNFTQKKAYLVKVQDEHISEIKTIISTVNKYVEDNIIPPAEKDKCKYCPYKSWCKSIKD
jgi:CRISPR/Cas system-associated exonuclease Cas4 (RecB family)